MYTNKEAWLIDKPSKFIPKGELVEVLDELESVYVIRYRSFNCLVRKEDLTYDKPAN